MSQSETDADADAPSIELTAGDECPEPRCSREVKTREFDFSPEREDSDRAGPVEEAYCIVHGIVEKA